MLSRLSVFAKGMLILGGDLNVALNPNLDTSDGKSACMYRALKRIKMALCSLQLMVLQLEDTLTQRKRIHVLLHCEEKIYPGI